MPKSQLRIPLVVICAVCAAIATISFVHSRASSNQQSALAQSGIQPSIAPTSTSASAVAPSTPAAGSTSPSGQSVSPSAQSAPPASQPQYRTVSLSALCSNTDSGFEYCGNEQTLRIGQTEYAFADDAQVYTGDSTVLSLPSTTCRNLSLRFAIGGEDPEPSELRITVTVVSQGSRYAAVMPDQLGKLTTNLNGGPFEIDVSANMGDLDNGSGWALLIDGSASCSTDTGS
jgi:hypothetical protein